MYSDVDIANLALDAIGANAIMAFTDDNTAAREINRVYAMIRDSELRKRNWSFAIGRASLPALSETPPFGFSFYYQLPVDYLKLIEAGIGVGTTGQSAKIFSPGLSLTNYRTTNEQAYAIEGSRIATDYTSPLFIRYIRRITDPTQFDVNFITALAMALALQVAERITGSSQKVGDAGNKYKMAIFDAIHANAIEKAPSPLPDDSWIMARINA